MIAWEYTVAQQAWLLWSMLGTVLIALGFRAVRPTERRSLHLVWLLLALTAGALSVFTWGPQQTLLAPGALNAAIVLFGLACIQLLTTLVFRGLLPALGLGVPRIANDLTVTGLSLAWGFVWLRLAGVDPTHLFTTSALITAVLAFSMQDTLGNVLGGVTLQLDNSLRVGDWVRVDDVSGRVADVHWRFTAIETRNKELVMMPNAWLMKNRFTVIRAGVNAPLAWRRAVQFNVDWRADPATVLHALERAVLDAEMPYVLKTPPPSAILSEVGAGTCRYTLRYWLGDPQYDDPGDSMVRVHALASLARAGVRLGVPQEERLMVKENESWRAAASQREQSRRIEAIRNTELFSSLPVPEQEALAAHLVHAPFAAGDILTRQGAVAHWLYLIIRGEADVLVDGPQGRVKVANLRDGAIFGEMGMLTGEARSATVVATTPVDCYRLDKAGFARVLQQRPEIAQEMSAIVAARAAERDVKLAQAGQPVQPRADVLDRILQFFSLNP